MIQVLLCITNNSIKHQSFVYIQENYQTVLFLTIQFSLGDLLALILNVHNLKIRPYQVLQLPVRVYIGAIAMKGYFRFLKSQRLEPRSQII